MTIVNINDIYQRKGKNIKGKKRGELGELISFKDNVERVMPRMIEKRVTKLMNYLGQQKAEGNLKNAFFESKREIEQILALCDAYDVDGSDFAERLDPKVRRSVYVLGAEYNKNGHLW